MAPVQLSFPLAPRTRSVAVPTLSYLIAILIPYLHRPEIPGPNRRLYLREITRHHHDHIVRRQLARRDTLHVIRCDRRQLLAVRRIEIERQSPHDQVLETPR